MIFEPGSVIVAGDWHGYTPHAVSVAHSAPLLLAGERRRLIVHLGDFGIWAGPAGDDYLDDLTRALQEADADIWVVPGNHENYDIINGIEAVMAPSGQPPPWPVTPRVWVLPRGHRWQWHGRTWLAVGGAVSVDKAGPPCWRCAGRRGEPGCRKCHGTGRCSLIEGVNWWPGEEITPGEAGAIIAAGPADVMVTHDCPAGVVHSFDRRPDWFHPADIARAEAHAALLQKVVDAVRPAHIMHGHLHMAYQRMADIGYGPVEVTGLDCEPRPDDIRRRGPNFAVLDTRQMTWTVPV